MTCLILAILLAGAILFVLRRNRRLETRVVALEADAVNTAQLFSDATQLFSDAMAAVALDIDANAQLMEALEAQRERQQEDEDDALFSRRTE